MTHPFLLRATVADQTVEHVREGIRAGRWKHHLPGSRKLAEELKVSRNTMIAAVERLIADGTLVKTGGRKSHLIASPGDAPSPGPRVLRTALLLMDTLEKLRSDAQREALRVVAEVKSAGHECVPISFPSGVDKSKSGLLARIVKEVEADAWLVQDGTLEILQWFVASGRPVLALGGISANLPIAVAATYAFSEIGRETFRRLIGLGHRRIVLICHHALLHPEPRPIIGIFREELQAVGVKPGEYNTPDWEETPGGLEALLESLFRFTPPTAIIGVTPRIAAGVLGFLSRARLAVPGDVSVVSLGEFDFMPEWVFPGVRLAHVESDDSPCYRRVRQWVTHVAQGLPDTRRFVCKARLNEGNTIGPAKESGERMFPPRSRS